MSSTSSSSSTTSSSDAYAQSDTYAHSDAYTRRTPQSSASSSSSADSVAQSQTYAANSSAQSNAATENAAPKAQPANDAPSAPSTARKSTDADTAKSGTSRSVAKSSLSASDGSQTNGSAQAQVVLTTPSGTEQALVTAVTAAANQSTQPQVAPKATEQTTPATSSDGGTTVAQVSGLSTSAAFASQLTGSAEVLAGAQQAATGKPQSKTADASSDAAAATAKTGDTLSSAVAEPVSSAAETTSLAASESSTDITRTGIASQHAQKQTATDGKSTDKGTLTAKSSLSGTSGSGTSSSGTSGISSLSTKVAATGTVSGAGAVAPVSTEGQNANSAVVGVPVSGQNVPLNAATAEDAESTATASLEKVATDGGKRSVAASSQNLVASTALHAGTTDSSNVELSAMSRELATANGAATQSQRTSTGTASESIYSTAGRDTFTSLDSSTGSGSTTWVHASAHEAEVGYQDPALGWVSVKASMSGGAIHASVVPSSAEAAQSLNAQMSGLNTYLNEQHSSVSSLTLESPSGNAMSGSSQGSGQDNAQSSAQQTQQNSAVSSVLGSDSVSENSTYERFNTGVSLRVPEGSSISVLV